MQDRPEGSILYYPPVSETQEVSHIPVERPSIQVLLPLLQAFFNCSDFYKAIKSSYLSLLRNFTVRIMIYTDDMLLMASSLEDLLIPRNTLIFILQDLGFLINIKSYLERTSTLEFLRVIVDSGKMPLSLPKEKLLNAQNHC